MIRLTDFDLHKLYGLIYYYDCEKYKEAIEELELALSMKMDPQIYYVLAECYYRLREYKKARDYALDAIELGYDAYLLFEHISWDNLSDYGETIKVLEKGMKKHRSSAYLIYAKYAEYHERPMYYDSAFEYAKDSKKGLVAYEIYKGYKELVENEYYFDNDKTLYYLKLFIEYGAPNKMLTGISSKLFDEYELHFDHDVISLLFDRCSYDYEAKIVFLLMLLEKQYIEEGSNYFDKNSIIHLWLTFLSKDTRRIFPNLLLAYNDDDFARTAFYLRKLKPFMVNIPCHYQNAFEMFLDTCKDYMYDEAL